MTQARRVSEVDVGRWLKYLAPFKTTRLLPWTSRAAPRVECSFSDARYGKRGRPGNGSLFRTNLRVLWKRGMKIFGILPEPGALKLVASLPCYLAENVDAVRGSGVRQDVSPSHTQRNGLRKRPPLTLSTTPGCFSFTRPKQSGSGLPEGIEEPI